MKLYREEGFPEHYGLNETNIMYRNHKSDKIISIMEEWWKFIENYSKRDQLSLSYVLWKNNMQLNYLTDTNIRLDTKNFEIFHHNKNKIISIEELYRKHDLSF